MTSGAFSLCIMLEGVLGMVMGRATDRFGPRMVITLCGFFLGAGYLLMSQTTSLWQFYLFYGVIVGIGLGGIWVPPVSIVVRWFTKRRNMMTGIAVAGTGIGGLITPLIANWLISTYTWRVSYVILGSVVLVLIVLAAQFLKRDPAQVGQLPYGENGKGIHELQLGNNGLSFREAVHTKQLWLVSGMFFLFGFCVFIIMVHIVPHAIELGISAVSAANILAINFGASIIGNFVLGGLGDRIGSRQIFIIGFILMVAALFWLVPARELWMLYLFAVVFGFAFGGIFTAESPLVAWLFGLTSHGLIFGFAMLGFTAGAAAGPLVMGYIFDLTGSYQVAFLVGGVVGILGLIMAVVLRPTKRLEIGA